MLPQINLNLAPKSLQRLYWFLFPLVPGSIAIAGTVLLRLGAYSTWYSHSNPYLLGAVLALFGYLAGSILVRLSAFSAMVSSMIFATFLPKERPNGAFSQRPEWRKVASEFLGPTLTPIRPADNESQHNYNVEWIAWYNILQDYLLRDRPITDSEAAGVPLEMQASGWALVYLRVLNGHAFHWAITVASYLLIFFGLLVSGVGTNLYQMRDRLPHWLFVAKLLAEVRAPSSSGQEIEREVDKAVT